MPGEKKLLCPDRRLFFDSTCNSVDRSAVSAKCQEAAKQACRQSADRLRELYNFDLNAMSPSRPTSFLSDRTGAARTLWTAERSTWKNMACSSMPASPREEWMTGWHWEVIDTKISYVPQFYHAQRYHSDGYLSSTYTPPTPVKEQPRKGSRPRNALDATHQSQHENSSNGQELTLTSKTPTLFRLWCARIRRASCADNAAHGVTEHKSRCNPKRTQSSERLPAAPRTTLISVPKNSPVKPVVTKHAVSIQQPENRINGPVSFTSNQSTECTATRKSRAELLYNGAKSSATQNAGELVPRKSQEERRYRQLTLHGNFPLN
ncbi:hypothetical protein CSKR_104531 [Clonorchis sinensis]|uniref:Uncharacterized protein n=2 Tax=Clonorchis sinensis TaxID=79923 RepID=H2KPN6_CLOSI|nr:hypothetical protein CSKR_104531 [Clonorchis sinensis]GAA34458.1 hypothetical protein CLF_102332 [Clonorchis sinensis]